MRESDRINALEDRVEVLESCLAEIETRLKLKRKPQPPRPPRPLPPRRSGTIAGPVIRVNEE